MTHDEGIHGKGLDDTTATHGSAGVGKGEGERGKGSNNNRQ